MNVTFENPVSLFAEADAETIGALVANTSDIAIIVDHDGMVRDVAGNRKLLSDIGADAWPGHRMEDVFPNGTARKLLGLADDIPSTNRGRATPVSHKGSKGDDVRIDYSLMNTGPGGNRILTGKDVTKVLSLQDRILELYRSVGDKLESHQQIEAQYRTLFAIGVEPVLLVDAATGKITDANKAALELIEANLGDVLGKGVSKIFSKSDHAEIKTLLETVAKTNAETSIHVTLTSGTKVTAQATPSLGNRKAISLHLMQSIGNDDRTEDDKSLVELIRAASEAIVLVDETGIISWANDAFVDLTMSGSVNATKGQSLKSYFYRSELDLDTILTNLESHNRIRMLPTSIRKTTGEIVEIELSAVTIPNVVPLKIGFFIRNVSLRVFDARKPIETSLDTHAMWDQLGKMPLRELVREEIDVVEKNFIIAALDLTGNNRAATAKVLGMSRQSLYQKLDRYGLDSDR